MEWHWADLGQWLQLLPHAVVDLQQREDAHLAQAGLRGFSQRPAATENQPRLILPDPVADAVAIGKEVDPAMSRSQQNMGLLLQDYLHNLPVYDASSHEAAQLLEHWRKILLEQPARLAEAKESFWRSGQARAFWQEHLKHIRPDHVVYMENDWEHAAGTALLTPEIQNRLKDKQWQDIVIRNRLHRHTLWNLSR